MATINKQVIEKLCNKLEAFSATLSDEERAAFKNMLEGHGLSDDALKQVTGGMGFNMAAAPARLSASTFHAAAGCW
jgi:hypothetical protein